MKQLYIDELLEKYELWYPVFYEKTVDYQFVNYNTLIAVLNDGTEIEYCSLDNTIRNLTKWRRIEEKLQMDEDTWRAEFGKNLRQAINASGINHDSFANKLGVSRQMVSRYVNGHATPSGYVLARMSEILRCDIDKLCMFNNDN